MTKMNYAGLSLRYIGPSGVLEKNEIVRCIADEGHRFIVQANKSVFGVNQVIFSDALRNLFITIIE
jgi:hypothetical protein